MATNAVYKVYNGTDWVEYYFKTSAEQVGVSGSRKFVTSSTKVNNVAFALDPSGNGASVTINGTNIESYAVAANPSADDGSNLHYIKATDKIATALGKLDQAVYAAAIAVPDPYVANATIVGNTLILGKVENGTASSISFTDTNTTYTFAEGSTNGAFSVTPSGGSAQSVSIHGLGAAAFKGVASSVTQNSTDLVTSGAVWNAIDNLPEPMVFKGSLGTGGTVSSLPTAGSTNEGHTYKVIEAGTYASQSAKIGDTFICAKTGTSTYEWVLIPSGDEPSGTVTSVGLQAVNGSGLSVSNSPITTSGTLIIGLASGYKILTTTEWGTAVKTSGNQDISGIKTFADGIKFKANSDEYGQINTSSNGIEIVVSNGNDRSATYTFAATSDESGNQTIATRSWVQGRGYLTSSSLSGYATESWVDTYFARVTAGTSAHSNPSAGDIWVDTNN